MAGGARECGVCWLAYEPDAGDDARGVPAGTAFEALPDDWRCPRCDSPKDRFVRPAADVADPRVAALEDAARAVARGRMAGLPLNNPALHVEAVGFRAHGPGLLGALVTPWSINVVYFPGGGEERPPEQGRTRRLPAGPYTFLPQRYDGAPPFEQLSLFSPALEFGAQADAVTAAAAALDALLAPPEEERQAHSPSRRALFGLTNKRGGA